MEIQYVSHCDGCNKELHGNEKHYDVKEYKNKLYVLTLCENCKADEVFKRKITENT